MTLAPTTSPAPIPSRTPAPAPSRAPVVISLPDGVSVSGVTTWALRLAGALATAGRQVVLAAHAEPDGITRLEARLPRGVHTVRLDSLPPLRSAGGNLGPFIDAYRDVFRTVSDAVGSPVVFAPSLLGDCYGIGAAICLVEPELVRLLAVQHSDIEYDYRVLGRYEPVIARFVGVSSRVTTTLRSRLAKSGAARSADTIHVPYGVPVSPALPGRAPVMMRPSRPLRLVYTGRMEHAQKRVGALVLLSDELHSRGMHHVLTLIGDGPAAPEIDAACAERAGRMKRMAGVNPDDVLQHVAASDGFVLASRYEGLSVSMLEAMSRGCVPILTRVASGAAEAVVDGESGFFADVDAADPDDRAVARALADAIERWLGCDTAGAAHAAWQTVRERFSLDRHAQVMSEVIDDAATSEPRRWPADRPCAYSAMPGGEGASGSIPADGAARLQSLLGSLAGRTVVLHGAGEHTVGLSRVLAASPARIVAVCDDDRARWGGSLLGWPVIDPANAAATGATDVVLSSWLHSGALWARRGIYERQGLRVHRVYPAD
ncbi:MAG: glycosyltransferase family 4 protein [Phycisphaeraceae bacterium]|nr:glycosyltransferase family 4 protein [Phycisphaeraceae bacterium]